MKTNVLTIGGMSCGHCSSRVEKALNALEGVQAKVDLQTGKATVEQTGSVTDAVLKKVVEEAGYDVLSVE